MQSILTLCITFLVFSTTAYAQEASNLEPTDFTIEKDLLLLFYDCKTDVDDLHTIAGFATLLSHPDLEELNYHGVAGTYGIQEGLYVPPNTLMQQAFGTRWTDAHQSFAQAIEKLLPMLLETLQQDGDLWIAEAGQSDFSAALVKAVLQKIPQLDSQKRIHIVQHSEWNERKTSPEALTYVKATTDYRKIPDGNATGNGSPGLRDAQVNPLNLTLKNRELEKLWELAFKLSAQYNGKEGRHNNAAIAKGGVDFSDLVEVCYILNLQELKDAEQFFKRYAY